MRFSIDEVISIYKRNIERDGLRNTPTRITILKAAYSHEGHFTAENIFHLIKKDETSVSLATVYNTLDLLEKYGLLRTHKFSNQHTEYEATLGYAQHDHMICLDCEKVIEFCDPRIQMIRETMGELLEFQVEKHALHLYGHCKKSSCEKAL